MGGFYYVNDEQGNLHECKACGRFRNDNIKPLAGDFVVFDSQNGLEYGFIEDIEPRTNELLRPAVANVDVMLLVVSASKPSVDFMLVDKLLIQAERAGISPVICINKAETGSDTINDLLDQYSAYDVICVSAYEKTGIAELEQILSKKCVCFAGQSAVGKSSIINVLGEGFELEVGGLSKKTARGKHTTRVVELMYLPKIDSYIFDTPGFSMFETGALESAELAGYYREFFEHSKQCRFSSCVHNKEPNCAVKSAVEKGIINKDRYERYLKIKKILEDKK